MSNENQGPDILPRLRARSGRRRAMLIAGVLLGTTVVGAGGISYAAMANGGIGWHHGHRLEMIQRHVRSALDGVGATTVQEDKIHDIIAGGVTALGDDREARRTMRREAIDLLRAPTIDKAAVEKLRAEQVARFDARSKAIMGMVLDSADQLSPEQRAALADRAEAMMARGPWGWHKGGGDRDGGRDGDEMHGRGGHGPGSGDERDPGGDRAPDGNPG